jgi:hypothetical protein
VQKPQNPLKMNDQASLFPELAILYVNRANHNVISEALNEGQNS